MKKKNFGGRTSFSLDFFESWSLLEEKLFSGIRSESHQSLGRDLLRRKRLSQFKNLLSSISEEFGLQHNLSYLVRHHQVTASGPAPIPCIGCADGVFKTLTCALDNNEFPEILCR
ncbi:hypothetical protein VNO77_44807 [Canavalia gladiata]|uniref:Uncharacterized protein n=1 Tax=Canavalia gladiata TaxID=3824 RepID=A0AAN9JZL2_CANGL